MIQIGLDIGSTTLKCVVLDELKNIFFRSYERHFSHVKEKTAELLERIRRELPQAEQCGLVISGSAGMGLANDLSVPFAQEVYATQLAVNRLQPGTDVVIELGGEDAKILFLQGGLEVRMNGSCAGGTGAFIDQMASLLDISVGELNDLAREYRQIYTIASRCGVFAKSDIQPLLNQGAEKADICASIFYAVVNQTIGGLAQGREIGGRVLYLGGSLTFFPELRRAFDHTLEVEGVCPEDSLYYVALGAAFSAKGDALVSLGELIGKITTYEPSQAYVSSHPLFENRGEYEAFRQRHSRSKVETVPYNPAKPEVWLGLDAGSTTVKAAVIDGDGNLVWSAYLPNSGNPIPLVRGFLTELYDSYPEIKIMAGAVTGYGEDMIKNAFGVDFGLVETVAHFTGAKKFMPQVDFILDIGGQDIKCFKIKNNTIDNIFLNEACSSGCGSFLQTFAGALGYTVGEFGKLGLFAENPVDLGSRCTVFMNSSVKQAQKDGATIENIAAGLANSVVKNALYKVVRTVVGKPLGEHIVVQGGTFNSDSVLRAFEQELGKEAVRPSISGLMGAYGAALYAQNQPASDSTIITKEQLAGFTHTVKTTHCNLCTNHCLLTVNTFGGGKKYIGGNRCDRPTTGKAPQQQLNMFAYKRELLAAYQPQPGPRGKIGLPMVLNYYELLPFWHTFFTALGFEVVTPPITNRRMYLSGQHTIPSDTVCFPAKLVHGHIEALLDAGIKTIFYPCMTYNLDEKTGDNHYNCPVVAYYPEVIEANVDRVGQITYIYDYLGLHRKKDFAKHACGMMNKYFDGISQKEINAAAEAAYLAYDCHMANIAARGAQMLAEAEAAKMPIIVLAGRPYHIDPEVSHGIDSLICDFGAAVLTEDSLPITHHKVERTVLNQWTYHARLYAAAEYIADRPSMNLVQLVSFGCGVDAITTDEVRSIVEGTGKIYTQLKIDEITNLGAVKIRLRSLFATMK